MQVINSVAPELNVLLMLENTYILFNGLTYNMRIFCELRSIFPSPTGARKNASNEQNVDEYYMLNHRIRDLLFRYKKVLFGSILSGKIVFKKMQHLSFGALANDVNSTESQPN